MPIFDGVCFGELNVKTNTVSIKNTMDTDKANNSCQIPFVKKAITDSIKQSTQANAVALEMPLPLLKKGTNNKNTDAILNHLSQVKIRNQSK